MVQVTSDDIIIGKANSILYVYSILLQNSKGKKDIMVISNKTNAGKMIDVVEILKTLKKEFKVEYDSETREMPETEGKVAYSSLLTAKIRFP